MKLSLVKLGIISSLLASFASAGNGQIGATCDMSSKDVDCRAALECRRGDFERSGEGRCMDPHANPGNYGGPCSTEGPSCSFGLYCEALPPALGHGLCLVGHATEAAK